MIELDLRGDFCRVQVRSEARRIAVFGPSGAGKTTLLHAVAGLTRLDGRVALSGRELNTPFVPAWARRIGLVFQDDRLFPHLDVRANIGFAGTPDADAIEALELGELLDRTIAGLSGGERRRVALARALSSDPEWLLLDEPLTGLDGPRRARVVELLQAKGLPHLLVTHTVMDVLRLSDEVLVLDGGRLLGQGDFFELCADERIFALADQSGLDNLVGAEAARDLLRVAGPRAGQALSIRPEDIILAADPPGRMSARNVLEGRVVSLLEVHGRVLVEVDVGVSLRASLTPAAVSELALAPGRPVHAIIKATAIRWV